MDISSASSSLQIIVPSLYPAGFAVDNYAADSSFEAAALTTKEDLMTADGHYHAGLIFNPVEWTITLAPPSSAASKLDDWQAYEKTAMSVFGCNAVLRIPSLSVKYTFVNGVLYTWTPVPPGKRILQPRPAVFRFEGVTRSAI
ncbi:phage tail fiber protein [Phytobacter ursingii]